MFTKLLAVSAGVILTAAGIASADTDHSTKFTIRIENITKADAFTASNGVKWSLAFSPGTAIVHTIKAPVFNAGKKDRGKGLEAQAEDGDPSMASKRTRLFRALEFYPVLHSLARAGKNYADV